MNIHIYVHINQMSTNQPWTKDEIELLIGWMEENPQLLRGKQLAWHKDVLQQVFSDEAFEHITLKKIEDKVVNMKRAWQAARLMADNSGWGV